MKRDSASAGAAVSQGVAFRAGFVMIVLLAAGAGQQGDEGANPPQTRPVLDDARVAWHLLQPYATGGQKPSYQAGSGRLVVPFPDASELEAGDLVALEDNRNFAYVVVDLSKAYGAPAAGPRVLRRLIYLKPATFLIDDQVQMPAGAKQVCWVLSAHSRPKVTGRQVTLEDEGGTLLSEAVLPRDMTVEQAGRDVAETVTVNGPAKVRGLHLLQAREPGSHVTPRAEVRADGAGLEATVTVEGKVCRLWLPEGRLGPGHIEIRGADGQAVVARRLLPSGVVPAAGMLERWDKPYLEGQRPKWDTGRPSPLLQKLVEQKMLRPCRAVDLGCGSGLNAVYLAQKGFDVTAIDIAPVALSWGEKAAEQAKVKVHWLQASVLEAPDLEPFDLLFDRGCYHTFVKEPERVARYVETVRRYSHPGTRFVLMTARWVTEKRIREDFSRLFDIEYTHNFYFDAREGKGRPAHLVIMRRKATPGPGAGR
jgi:SAM-dependent methyltransferase